MNLVHHALVLAVRLPGRSFVAGLSVAIAAALLTAVLLFGTAAGTTATRRALAAEPVDAQIVLAGGSQGAGTNATPPGMAAAAEAIARADPAVQDVLSFGLVHFDGASLDRAGVGTQTSAGAIVGIDAAYTTATGLFPTSGGSATPGQARISRDLATNLGAVPGDEIAFSLPGGATVKLAVSGIVDLSGADLVLGPVDAAHRAAGANPPANVAIVDRVTLASLIAPLVPPGAVAAPPGGTLAGGAVSGSGPVPGAEAAVRTELHLRYNRAQMPGDPVAAQQWLDQVRRRIEAQGAGAFTVADDASAALASVASDVSWGQVLFIFLALPGILLALALSEQAGEATADTTRRHAALLRARGAPVRDILTVFVLSGAIVAAVGSVLGGLAGLAVSVALFGPELTAAEGPVGIAGAVIVASVASLVLAIAAAAIVLRGQVRDELAIGRQDVQLERAPLWRRLYLDVIAIGAGIAVFVFTGGAGLHPVLTAEGNPTVTLALTAFVAPLLVWSGGTFLLFRLMRFVAARSSGSAGLLRRLLGPGGELAARSLVARSPSFSRTIVLLALAVSFATSVLVFDATYTQQQRVDAALTLGADIKAVPATTTTEAEALRAAQGAGLAAVTPFVDRVVYVGAEAQDLLAVDPGTLIGVAAPSDTFFEGLTAAEAMTALKQRPSTILVSAETAKDYSLVTGDRVRVRIPDATGALRSVDFQMGGIVDEFPTAPHDAFLVANLDFVRTATANSAISFLLARVDGDLASLSALLGARLGSAWRVEDLTTTTARLANNVTSVDLGHLVQIDLAFAILIAAIGAALFLLAGINERRRELATLRAIGAEPGQLRSLLLGETAIVGIVGIVVGLGVGLAIGAMLLQVLAGIFDPPAQAPAIPLGPIGAAMAAVVVGLSVALAIGVRSVGHLNVMTELRER